MGTTAEKLSYLNETKQAIKNALKNKNATVDDGDTFRSYAQKIDQLNVAPANWVALPPKADLDNNAMIYDMDDFSWGAMLYLKALEGTSNMYASWKGTSKSITFLLDGVEQNCTAKLVSSHYGDKEGLVFLVSGLSQKYPLFDTSNTSGGWGTCSLRTKLQEEILPQLPQDLQDVLQTNSVTYGIGGSWLPDVASASNTSTCSDVLFVPSLGELKGNSNFTYNGTAYTLAFSEGTQFEFFAENESNLTSKEDVMTRTCTDASRCAYVVANSTTANCAYGNTETTLSFCFTI